MATTAADDRKRLDELFEQGEDLQNHVAQTHRLVDQITSTQQLRYRRLVDRGTQFHAVGDYVGAIEAFSGALDADPNGYVAYINRGTAHQGLGQWHRALADYIVARNLEPENYVPWNNAAWLFATCPDERVRDADLAFDAATKACQLSDWKEAGTISTLAAAHAERGEFDAAINRINEAIKLAPEAVHGELMEQRTLFENRQPVRIGLTPSESATPDAENSESASP
jgi:tetratricopeptide (TPR) repeat protein